MVCKNYKVCSDRDEKKCRDKDFIIVCNNDNHDLHVECMNKRKVTAFDWLDENADELSLEWTGSHHHIYSGNEENLERLGSGRLFIDAVEDCYT